MVVDHDAITAAYDSIYDPENVFIGLYHERTDDTAAYVIINYVPPSITGVKKARVQLHLHRVGTMFKEHQTTITVEDLSQLTTTTIQTHLKDEDNPTVNKQALPKPVIYESVRRSFSEIYAPNTYPPPAAAPSKPAAGMLATFLRRKKRTNDSTDYLDDMPPPTPPKDTSNLGHPQPRRYQMSAQEVYERSRTASISEFAVISHFHSDDGLDPEPSVYISLPLKGKWASESGIRVDAAERARRRREEQIKKEEEEREVLRQEEERQLGIKRRKEERMREHLRLEKWRKEQAALAAEVAREAAEARQHEEAERKKKIQLVEAIVKCNSKVETLFNGWVTMQLHNSLVWKRRFYKVEGDTIYFYRSPEDTNQALDETKLPGNVRGLKEWKDGYEHLEAIPHSFVIEFTGDRDAWLMYADSEEEKFKVLGVIHHAARL
ncbi:hypothetical protein BDQ17DRAFT_1505172 [Cyathus striatus]|nr:hypothetical protein BDQ17DRAFT_1505172 [Cyathus striatus]